MKEDNDKLSNVKTDIFVNEIVFWKKMKNISDILLL